MKRHFRSSCIPAGARSSSSADAEHAATGNSGRRGVPTGAKQGSQCANGSLLAHAKQRRHHGELAVAELSGLRDVRVTLSWRKPSISLAPRCLARTSLGGGGFIIS
ncbi:hypothetical protein SLE2022_093280 [Rubroshorea leprosula]